MHLCETISVLLTPNVFASVFLSDSYEAVVEQVVENILQ